MTKSNIIKLIFSLILPLSIGAFAGMFTSKAIPVWYATLNSPSFNPPNWLFGPVWTTLYILMGISFYLIWKQEKSEERNFAMLAFLIQLALNFAWSFIFFYFNKIGFAFAEIVLLWLSIVLMIIRFYKIKPITAYINIPYLLWVSFASMLNLSYYLLN